jgi:hypothetical protein
MVTESTRATTERLAPCSRDECLRQRLAGGDADGFAFTNEKEPLMVAAPFSGGGNRNPARVLAMQGTAVLVAIVPAAPRHQRSTAPSAPTWSRKDVRPSVHASLFNATW